MGSSSPELTSILNFRDVGKTINGFLGERRLREGRLYRSARPDDATLEDRKILTEHLGIRSVLDLRTKTEHLNAANKRDADLAVPAIVQSNAALAEPVQIPGLKYHEVRITGGAFEKFLVSQLSWWGFFSLIGLYLFGYRNEAICILSREVMLPRGLVGMGLDTLDQSGPEIANALKALIEPPGLPIIVHCTLGKDRTGLMVALTLMILRVPTEAIEHDYALTDAALNSERHNMVSELEKFGLTHDWGFTCTDMISGMEKHLGDRHGGLEAYLDAIGFGKTERTALMDQLLY